MFVYSVEIYDPIKDKWEEGTPLTSGRSGHASAVIYQPSCANQYMDYMDEPINKNKKPPSAEEDDSSRGPSTSKNASQSGSSSNVLHAYSGNRCSHCDDAAKDTDHVDQEQRNKRTQKPCPNEQSNHYEIACRNAIHSLLQMDCDLVVRSPERNENSLDMSDDTTMDIPNDEREAVENNLNDYRRRMSYELEDSEMSENSNSRDSLSPNLQNHLEFKTNDNCGRCSFSKLRRRVRKNISNFVAWSSTPRLNESYDMAAGPTIQSNNRAACSDNKCNMLKKYYKCKLKS